MSPVKDWSPRSALRNMDDLLKEVRSSCGRAHLELSRPGSGKWWAHLQCVNVRDEYGAYIAQPFFEADRAEDALDLLVKWLRGKSVSQSATGSGVPGPFVNVPVNLEAPTL
jgi:hypothetical protein